MGRSSYFYTEFDFEDSSYLVSTEMCRFLKWSIVQFHCMLQLYFSGEKGGDTIHGIVLSQISEEIYLHASEKAAILLIVYVSFDVVEIH